MLLISSKLCVKTIFNRYRDLLLNLRIPFNEVCHVCKLQLHLHQIVEVEKWCAHEYFRLHCFGNVDVVRKRLMILLKQYK